MRGFLKTLQAYKSRLRTAQNEYSVILYCRDHLFEFNPSTIEIRPFNSIIWYDINMDEFTNFIYHIVFIHIRTTASEIDEKDIMESDVCAIYDKMITVDISDPDKFIKEYSSEDGDHKVLKESMENFASYITDLYDNWNDAYTFLLNNYADIDKLKLM